MALVLRSFSIPFCLRTQELQEEVESRNRERQRALRRLSKVGIVCGLYDCGSPTPSLFFHSQLYTA